MFRPLQNRVLVRPEEKPTETASGLYLAEKIVEKPVIGVVVVGNKDVNEGDRVLFSKFGYDEVTLDGEVHYVVSDHSILGIFKQECEGNCQNVCKLHGGEFQFCNNLGCLCHQP